jgi:hypothetical protein
MTKPRDPNCCLCGLPYERVGNNPEPLAAHGRCCDACDEVVIEARIDMKRFTAELDRVEEAMLRVGPNFLRQTAVAVICASRGPLLLAEKKRQIAKLYATIEDDEREV